MQINSVKDSTKVLETGLKDIDKDVKVQEPIHEKISLGEASNKNIRTKTLTYGDTVNKLKEEDRELNKFKEKTEKAVETLEYNAKSLSPDVIKELEDEGVSAKDSDADLVKKSIENIVQNREIRRENLAKQAEKLSEAADDIKEISYSAIGDSTLAKQLENSGMAVTRENMDKLSSAVNATLSRSSSARSRSTSNSFSDMLPPYICPHITFHAPERAHWSSAGPSL